MFFTYDRLARVLFWGCVSGILAETLSFLGIASCWSVFFTCWLLSAGTFLLLASLRHSPSGKAVLISGCDSGFGLAAALHLHEQGFIIFAGCLEAKKGGEGAKKLQKMGSDRLHVVQLDVTKQEEIDEAMNVITNTLKGQEVLWGIINNAGIHIYGAVEWVSMAYYKKLLEVNLFGTVALTKACLPLIRRAKGRVVNMASGRGRMASPLGTTYESSKFAIEGFSDGLRLEMKSWGVDVSIIEPGNFVAGTKVLTKEVAMRNAEILWNDMSEQVKADFGGRQAFDRVLENQLKICSTGSTDLSQVVDAMEDALLQKYPQGRYQCMTLYTQILVFISQHFPEFVHDFVCLEVLMKMGW